METLIMYILIIGIAAAAVFFIVKSLVTIVLGVARVLLPVIFVFFALVLVSAKFDFSSYERPAQSHQEVIEDSKLRYVKNSDQNQPVKTNQEKREIPTIEEEIDNIFNEKNERLPTLDEETNNQSEQLIHVDQNGRAIQF